MRLRSRAYQEEAQVDMTPMLDVVFILLIFFIVSTAFVKESGIDVERPQASSQQSSAQQVIQIAIAENGDIYLDKNLLDIRQLGQQLKPLLNTEPVPNVVLQADRRVSHGRVVSVMDEAKKAGAQNLAIATDASE